MTDATAVPAEIVGFIDIGTNSIRLLVVRIEPNHSYSILHRLKETVRLGEGEFGKHLLQPQAIERAVAVVRQFAAIARNAGAVELHAVATAATREAENQHAFLKRLLDDAMVEAHVISGLEEARLVYLGVVHNLDIGEQLMMCIDIGGGSTEVAVGTRNEHLYLNSLKLGAIRLSSLFLADEQGPISDKLYGQVRDYVRHDADRSLNELRAYRPQIAVGSSGTIETVGEVAARLYFRRGWQRDDVLTHAQVQSVISYLRSLTLMERMEVPGMNPARADIIIGGAAIIDVLMEESSIKALRISDRGVRDGMLVDYLLRHDHTALAGGLPVRERSVLQLGRQFRFNEAHARTTARLALALFDDAKAAGLHSLGREQRELLHYAALLHHIGALLSHTSYQKHTHYLVGHADLLGFDQTEIAITAAICLYHRGSLPRKRDEALATLSPAEQEAVQVSSMLLRLAENLDRGQSSCVRAVHLAAMPGDRIEVLMEASGDCHVELSGLSNQMDAFRKTFGRRLSIRRVQVD
jgi:exopolyphosphatase/guanosine-5'-triphosphate,3'-diphosphate pyrophosphatase